MANVHVACFRVYVCVCVCVCVQASWALCTSAPTIHSSGWASCSPWQLTVPGQTCTKRCGEWQGGQKAWGRKMSAARVCSVCSRGL
jgi:hypothetical protein